MFKFLRSQAKIFYWVIAATFILFLFLGGLTGRGCQAPGSRQIQAGVLGSVNGTQISAQAYDMTYRQLLAQMRQQTQSNDLNANQIASARRRAWDSLVQRVLIQQAIEEYGIKVSDEEVLDTFRNNPPPELLEGYRDENGDIDMNRYYADLQNPENDWSRVEEYIRSMLPQRKLEARIVAEAFVTDLEIHEEYLRQTGRAVAEYVGVGYSDLNESYEPGDEEIQAWYDSHLDDYQIPAVGNCKVARFEKKSSEADYEEVLSFANEIREEILSGQIDFDAAAREYSEDTSSAELGGNLGTFDRNRMGDAFTEAAFSLPEGEISEPVRTEYGWHLIEVSEHHLDQETGEIFQITAGHILLKVQPGPYTMDALRESAQSFRDRVDGDTFLSTVEAEALDLVEPVPFIEGRDLPGIPFSVSGNEWVFAGEAGRVSSVFENRNCLYVVLAEGVTPAGPAPLDEVAGQVSLAVRQARNLETARTILGPAVGELQMGKSYEEVTAGDDLLHAVTDTFTMNGNVPDVGYGTEFNKLAIEGEVGVLIPEVETNRGLFALTPLWIRPVDEAELAARGYAIEQYLLSRKQSEVLDEWFQERMDSAEIVDHRQYLQ